MVLVGLVLIKLFVSTAGDLIWDRVTSMFWQQQCLTYRLPEDCVMYFAAANGADLPAGLADFSSKSATWNGMIGARNHPLELIELDLRVAPTSEIAKLKLPAPVFMHGLKDSKSRTRLVTVWALANNPRGWWTLLATTRPPADDAAKRTDPILSTACWPMSQDSPTFIVFAGQPDPNDQSRFSLRVRLRGKDQIVTGTLKDDGTIEFKSSTGLSAWNTDRAGPLIRPDDPRFARSDSGSEGILLPVD
jgi:hypothetical protein